MDFDFICRLRAANSARLLFCENYRKVRRGGRPCPPAEKSVLRRFSANS
ncbi:hypothetical protein [Oscillospiraceae bacterium]|nr:hypothetical protein [Oscillospiraceae bacterium]